MSGIVKKIALSLGLMTAIGGCGITTQSNGKLKIEKPLFRRSIPTNLDKNPDFMAERAGLKTDYDLAIDLLKADMGVALAQCGQDHPVKRRTDPSVETRAQTAQSAAFNDACSAKAEAVYDKSKRATDRQALDALKTLEQTYTQKTTPAAMSQKVKAGPVPAPKPSSK